VRAGRRPSSAFAFALVLALGASSCTPALQVKAVETAEEKPANVLLFFRVAAEGQAVPGLQESAFSVVEDDRVVGPGVDRVLVNPDLRAQQATIVLLDLGGRPGPSDLEALSAATQVLVDRLGGGKRLALYALDGAEQPQVLAPLGASPDALKAAATKVAQFKTRDPSLDLNSGYVAALHNLQRALPASGGPKIGNVVLLARDVDRASRVDLKTLGDEARKLGNIDVGRFVIAYGGPGVEKLPLAPYTDTKVQIAMNAQALKDAAGQVSDAVDARGRSYYLLSYCSTARAGEHKLKLEVSRTVVVPQGLTTRSEVQKGSLTHAFRADGFGPGCTPSVPEGWRPDGAPAAPTAPTPPVKALRLAPQPASGAPAAPMVAKRQVE
jgi:hypothetical protein